MYFRARQLERNRKSKRDYQAPLVPPSNNDGDGDGGDHGDDNDDNDDEDN